MLTEEQINFWAKEEYKYNSSLQEESAAINGATWANEQNNNELVALCAENAKLREALKIVMDGFSHVGAGENAKAVFYVPREDWRKAYSIMEIEAAGNSA